MFNFLVAYSLDTWNGDPTEFELGRVAREYTANALTEKYGSLDDAAVQEIMTFPALFAYEEAQQGDARIGWIKRVRTRDRQVRVDYILDDNFPAIPAVELGKLDWDLEIGSWEMSRTHWAIKDADLFSILLEAGLITDEQIRSSAKSSSMSKSTLGKRAFAPSPRTSVFRIPKAAPEADLVSVMMPFDAIFDGVFATIKSVCEASNLRCDRADNVWEESEVIQDVFSLIYRSRIVVCDFSGRNPNVFYETGIAHALDKLVIPLVQENGDVPFDLRHHRFIKYLNNQEGRVDLAKKLARRLATLLALNNQ
jgi:hypothetical protein